MKDKPETPVSRPQIAEMELYAHEEEVFIDFRENGGVGWYTAKCSTQKVLLAQGFVELEDPEDGDEYEILTQPFLTTGPTQTVNGILYAPQVAAAVIGYLAAWVGYEPGKPGKAPKLEVLDQASAVRRVGEYCLNQFCPF